jgi:hypothetical protein
MGCNCKKNKKSPAKEQFFYFTPQQRRRMEREAEQNAAQIQETPPVEKEEV